MKGHTRITIDLDTFSPSALRFAFRELNFQLMMVQKPKKTFDELIWFRFSRKKGYHILFWMPGKLSKKDVFYIRECAGDDPKRIRKDKLRKGAPKQILFNDAGKTIWKGDAWK